MLAIMSICFELCYNDKNHNFSNLVICQQVFSKVFEANS